MQPVATDKVARSVGLSVMTLSPEKAAKPIKMPFGIWTRVGPRNDILSADPAPQTYGGSFEGQKRLVILGHVQQSIYSISAGASTSMVRMLFGVY